MTVNDAVRDWPGYYQASELQARDRRLQSYFQAGCPGPETPLSAAPFVALDFETTGLDADKDEIISIGLVPFDLQRIRLRDAQQWLLKPRRELGEDSVVIHGITHSDLEQAPDLLDVLPGLLNALAGRVVVVHYRYIEREFLEAALMRRIGEGIRFPVIDTMELEAQLYRRGVGRLLGRLIGLRQTSIRLSDSRSRYNLPHYGLHNAMTDAIATAELLQAQIRHRFDADTPLAELWL